MNNDIIDEAPVEECAERKNCDPNVDDANQENDNEHTEAKWVP